MSEAPAHLLSLEWWLTVVVVGIGVHLAASYLKPRLDKAGGRVFRAWATHNAERARKRQLRVELLRSSESRRLMAAQENMHHLLTAVLLGVLTVVALLSSFFLTYLIQVMMTIAQPSPSPYPPRISMLPLLLLLIAFVFSIRAINNLVEAKKIASELGEALGTLEE